MRVCVCVCVSVRERWTDETSCLCSDVRLFDKICRPPGPWWNISGLCSVQHQTVTITAEGPSPTSGRDGLQVACLLLLVLQSTSSVVTPPVVCCYTFFLFILILEIETPTQELGLTVYCMY